MSKNEDKSRAFSTLLQSSEKRKTILTLSSLAAVSAIPSLAFANQKVRIGLATKTWWPSVICETAEAQGLFKKMGLAAELTVYRSGGECVEALAAGAADMIPGLISQVGTARKKGVPFRMVSLAATANTGWKLLVRADSKITNIKELAGKKVGITAAGSLSDLLALWTKANQKIDFTNVPLGGGGLVPNLLSGNVDAAVVYPPLSFQVLQNKQAKSLMDYSTAIPSHLATGWVTTDKFIESRAETLKASLAAIYGSVRFMQDNPDRAMKIVADVNNIAPAVAKEEFEETYMRLSRNGVFTAEQVKLAMELAVIGGFKDLAPQAEITTDKFVPIA